jgi:hypothetical protein
MNEAMVLEDTLHVVELEEQEDGEVSPLTDGPDGNFKEHSATGEILVSEGGEVLTSSGGAEAFLILS